MRKNTIQIEHSNMLDLFLTIIKEQEDGHVCEATDMSINMIISQGYTIWHYSSGKSYYVKYCNIKNIESLYNGEFLTNVNIDNFVKDNKDKIEKIANLKAFL
jgi:hypothetical protein